MNILLVGEYSRLHNSLREGLEKLGHTVVIVGFTDGFKDYPVDYPIRMQWDSIFLKKIKAGIYKFSGANINSYFTYRQFKNYQRHLTGFDVVQLINENSFYCGFYFERKILKFLFENNKKAFLLCCGNDSRTVRYDFDHPEKKSILQPYFDGKIKTKDFWNVLKFSSKEHVALSKFIYSNIAGIIASDIDYDIPMQHDQKYLGMIPNPVNIDKLQLKPAITNDKIMIFHGINQGNYFKKGNDFFEKALDIIREKYSDKVEIITTRSIPYEQYIGLYDKSHILLDMVYSYDQGYNALEAMAKGKVVFTGAEKEFEKFYKLTERVCINAKPDINYLVAQLSELIENPQEIKNISYRARLFVETEHHYILCAKKYLNIWNQ